MSKYVLSLREAESRVTRALERLRIIFHLIFDKLPVTNFAMPERYILLNQSVISATGLFKINQLMNRIAVIVNYPT